MNLDNSSSHEEPFIEGNTRIPIRLNNMKQLQNEVKTIVVFGKKYIGDYERGIRNDMSHDEYKRKVNELILKITIASRLYLQYDDETYNIFNFNMPENNNNNLLMFFCSVNFNSTICNHIINEYGYLFDLGFVNDVGETALIICIKNQMFDVALNIVNYRHDPEVYDYPNMGMEDIRGQNALDYMLSYIVYEDDSTINPKNNKMIIDNIDIISELLFFHLDKLYHDPANKLSQYYIDFFCKTRDFWRPLLEDDFEENVYIDFQKTTKKHNNKVCDDIKNFEAKPLYNDGIASAIEERHYRELPEELPVAQTYQPHQLRVFRGNVTQILPPIILDSPSRRRSRSRSRSSSRSRSPQKHRRVGGKKTIHKVKSKPRKTISRKTIRHKK